MGVDPIAVTTLLGPPSDQSAKQNPLVLRYGALELTFSRDKQGPLSLVQLKLVAPTEANPLPDLLAPVQAELSSHATLSDFTELLRAAGLHPEQVIEGDPDAHVVMPAGVRASFRQQRLLQLTLTRREREENRFPKLGDAREPSEAELEQMLKEARHASALGLRSAALVLAWAALEATMRRVAVREGRTGRVGTQPTVLLRELYALHLLGSEDVAALEGARQLRTSIVHGLSAVIVPADVVMSVIAYAERLGSPQYSREPETG
jgi:hypothetical protein